VSQRSLAGRLLLVLLVAVHGAAAAGCPSSQASLTVRVQSGLRAGFEVRYVDAALYEGALPCGALDRPIDSAGRTVAPEDQTGLGRGTLTVTTFDALEHGVYTVRARFRRPQAGTSVDGGPVLVERCVTTNVSSDRVIRIALTSDCVGVTCPAATGDPAFDQCVNGRCVDPRCDPDDPSTASYCCDRTALGASCDDSTFCASDGDCEAVASCSGGTVCASGICVTPDEDTCPAGEYCDTARGACLSEPPLVDPDAGRPDAGMAIVDAAIVDAFAGLDAPGLDAPGLDAYELDAAMDPDAYSAPDACVAEICDEADNDCDRNIDEGCRIPVHRAVRDSPVVAYRYTTDPAQLVTDGYRVDRMNVYYVYPPDTPGFEGWYQCQFSGGGTLQTRSPDCEGHPETMTITQIGRVYSEAAASGGCVPMELMWRINPGVAPSFYHSITLGTDPPTTGAGWMAEDPYAAAHHACVWSDVGP
jgi:hypothetical protein